MQYEKNLELCCNYAATCSNMGIFVLKTFFNIIWNTTSTHQTSFKKIRPNMWIFHIMLHFSKYAFFVMSTVGYHFYHSKIPLYTNFHAFFQICNLQTSSWPTKMSEGTLGSQYNPRRHFFLSDISVCKRGCERVFGPSGTCSYHFKHRSSAERNFLPKQFLCSK